MHLLIDNYDSFTWNVVQALAGLGAEVRVERNDALSVDEAVALAPESLIVSPGPGRPDDAGLCKELIRRLAPATPVLGICLGHQCIVEVFGGTVGRAERVMHGKVSNVYHRGGGLYDGVSNPFAATRYHSLIAYEQDLPAELDVCAFTSDGEIMGVRHRTLLVEGVQFHPESILTREGPKLLENFLRLAAARRGAKGGAT
jgi:anthranilate synthase/aminodeoxychorismate synthase-like glutamine amidotransferase